MPMLKQGRWQMKCWGPYGQWWLLGDRIKSVRGRRERERDRDREKGEGERDRQRESDRQLDRQRQAMKE